MKSAVLYHAVRCDAVLCCAVARQLRTSTSTIEMHASSSRKCTDVNAHGASEDGKDNVSGRICKANLPSLVQYLPVYWSGATEMLLHDYSSTYRVYVLAGSKHLRSCNVS